MNPGIKIIRINPHNRGYGIRRHRYALVLYLKGGRYNYFFCTGFEMTRRELEPVIPTLKDAGFPWELTLHVDDTDLERKARLEVEAERRIERAFVGMDYFTEADASRFKGRDDDAQALWRRMMAVPLTLLPIRDTIFFNSSWVAERSLNFSIPPLEAFLRKHDFLKADALIFNNLLLHKVFHWVESPVKMYRVEDDLEGFGNIPRALLDIDKDLIRKADVVLTTAHRLTDKARQLRPSDVYYIPNAADFDHFQIQRVRMPREYADIPGPRVIYVGMIDFWFDVPLLRAVASRLSRFSFVVIGPSSINLRALQGIRNIFLLGSGKDGRQRCGIAAENQTPG